MFSSTKETRDTFVKDKDLINLELGKLSLVSSIMCDMGPQSTFMDVREEVARAVGHALDTPMIDLMIIDPFTGQVNCGGSGSITEQMRQAFMALGEGILTDLTGFNTLLMELRSETVNGNRPERTLYRAGVRSVLAHPIRSGVGTCGALAAYYTTHEGAADNKHLVETITAQAAAVLSCARSIEQYQQHARRSCRGVSGAVGPGGCRCSDGSDEPS